MCLQCRVGLQYSRYYQRASTVFAKKILTSMSGFTLGDPRHLNSHVDTRLKSHAERHTSVLSSSYHDFPDLHVGKMQSTRNPPPAPYPFVDHSNSWASSSQSSFPQLRGGYHSRNGLRRKVSALSAPPILHSSA